MKDDNNYIILDNFGSDRDFLKVANKLTKPYVPAGRYYKITKIGKDMFEFYDIADKNKFTYHQQIFYTLVIPYRYGSADVKTFAQNIDSWHVGDVFVRIENNFASIDYPTGDSRLVIAHVDDITAIDYAIDHPAPDYKHVWFENIVDPFVDKTQLTITEIPEMDNRISYSVQWVYEINANQLFVNDDGKTYRVKIKPECKVDFANRIITIDIVRCQNNSARRHPYGIPFLSVLDLGKQCGDAHFRARLNAEYSIDNGTTLKTLEESINV